MPKSFEFAELGVPEDSEYRALLDKCPDIGLERFLDGEYLMHEGERTTDIFLVVRGAYAVETGVMPNPDKPAETLATVLSSPSEPSFVGEMAYLGSAARNASVRSAGCTHALVLKPEHLDVIIESLPLFTRILCRQFAHRLRESTELLKVYQRECNLDAEQVIKKAGEVLFEPGESADVLYQLIDGALARETPQGEETLTVSTFEQGFIDPLPFLQAGTYTSRVIAKTGSFLVAISRSSERALLRRYPELALRALRLSSSE